MLFEEAWQLVAMAGRELGSGPAEAVKRLVLDHEDIAQWMAEHRMNDERIGSCLLGIAVGKVMAEDPSALQTIRDITEEWLHGD
jgi:hypothetical protein